MNASIYFLEKFMDAFVVKFLRFCIAIDGDYFKKFYLTLLFSGVII